MRLIFEYNGINGKPVSIPWHIWRSCRLARLINKDVQVYRVMDDSRKCVFSWPARKMKKPQKYSTGS